MNSVLEILHRDDLPLGGFAGLKEHRLVMDARVWRHHKNPTAWDGLGNFVYLADAYFNPHGETGMHPHREVDVISVMVEGRIAHAGSLGDGGEVAAPNVQVQRAGGEGFTHNETNPDDAPNRMIQIWILPEQPGQPAGYKTYQPQQGNVTRIYGGPADKHQTFASQTVIEVALLNAQQEAHFDGPLIAYLTKGSGSANGQTITDGDMLRGADMHFIASEAVQLIVVRQLG